MGNVYRYTPVFFYFYFLLILMNVQKRKYAYKHIEKKLCLVFNLVPGLVVEGELLLRYDHFVGASTFFRIILCIFTSLGKGKLF